MIEGIHLTLLMGPTIPLPAPQQVVDALTSAQVTVTAGSRSGFQLTFAVSNESLLNRVLLPAGYFDPKIRVILMAIVNGMPNVLMDGVITRQDLSPSNEPGQSTLSVTGEDISLLMDLDDVEAVYPNMPVNVIVTAILAKYALYGLIPLVLPPPVPYVPPFTERFPTQRATDAAYIRQLASEVGYVFYVDAGPVPGVNTAYFGPEIRIGIPQPALNVGMDAHTNVDSLSFGFDGLSRRLLGIVIQEPNTKLGITIPFPAFDILRPPLSVRPAPALRTEPIPGVAKLTFPEAVGLAMAQAARSADAITGQGSLDVLRYGRVLGARKLVGVRGAGLAYDGLYYVRSVTHQLKRGQYTQSFSLTREGLVSITPAVPA